MQRAPKEVQKFLAERKKLREQKRYSESDEARKKIEAMGYALADTRGGTEISKINEYVSPKESFLVLFGSGETAPSAVKAHSCVLEGIGKDKPKIVILSTPAGFQPNIKIVCEEIRQFFERHLKNYHPQIEIAYANTLKDANNPALAKSLSAADYIFAGPGSPTYAVRSLRDSLLLTKILASVRAGASLGLSSAAAIAFSAFALPVYEIYKAGFDLYWKHGLNFYTHFFQELVVVTHFNNNEGGRKNDTSRAWMGKERFEKLLAMLPPGKTIWGLDEHTAVIINLKTKEVETLGKGKLWKYTI